MYIQALIHSIRTDDDMNDNPYLMQLCDGAEKELEKLERYKELYLNEIAPRDFLETLKPEMMWYKNQQSPEFLTELSNVGPTWEDMDKFLKETLMKPYEVPTSEEFDKAFDDGESVVDDLDLPLIKPWREDGSGRNE